MSKTIHVFICTKDLRPTFPADERSSAKADAVALAKLPNCNAAAWSPTVGTAAFAAATIFPAGYKTNNIDKWKMYQTYRYQSLRCIDKS